MSGKKQANPIFEGNMYSQIRDRDWSETPLGPMDQWPEAFSSLLITILEIRIPILICWGDQLISIYNDAYRPLLGENPDVLGRQLPVKLVKLSRAKLIRF